MLEQKSMSPSRRYTGFFYFNGTCKKPFDKSNRYRYNKFQQVP